MVNSAMTAMIEWWPPSGLRDLRKRMMKGKTREDQGPRLLVLFAPNGQTPASKAHALALFPEQSIA